MASKFPKQKSSNSPYILGIMTACVHYNIEQSLMRRLNFNDLLYIIVNMQINDFKRALEQKQGKSVANNAVEATPDQATKFFLGR